MSDKCLMGGNHEYPKDVYGGHCIKCGQSPVISHELIDDEVEDRRDMDESDIQELKDMDVDVNVMGDNQPDTSKTVGSEELREVIREMNTAPYAGVLKEVKELKSILASREEAINKAIKHLEHCRHDGKAVTCQECMAMNILKFELEKE